MRLKLTRNLRRSILQGHPWVFREAIERPPQDGQARLCQVSDSKGDLAWAMFDPHGTLCLRILSTEKNPPQTQFWLQRFDRAWNLRTPLRRQDNSAYRLFNGEGDLLPGLVCDVYGNTAVLQFDGQGPSEFWQRELLVDWLKKQPSIERVVEKTRRSSEKNLEILHGPAGDSEVSILENGAHFIVNLEKGQKTGFFLDQRDNRHFVRQISRGKSVLNLFSYTGGFSVNAGLGGAKKVASLDVSAGAIELADKNWQANSLPLPNHQCLAEDVFVYLKDSKETWEHIIVDPPSMSHSESQKNAAKAKYIELFAMAGKKVHPGGELSLSSCSSHISFTDFFEIIQESLSQIRRTGQVLRVSGQGFDHPFPHACPELRYLKFVHLALGK